jgi:two-component system chemotaxis response regulator CheB
VTNVGTSRLFRVLVVDDSALVRESLQRLLGRYGPLHVTVAADPIIAQRKIASARPDVILLDLSMPRMDGLSFLEMLMASDPIPVVVFSAMTGGATDGVFLALEAGAVDVVTKPQIGMREFLAESLQMLAETLAGAASAKVVRRCRLAAPRRTADAVPRLPRAAQAVSGSAAVVAMGASTGGTEALGVVLGALPIETPGIAVVQHMPEGFTAAFAKRLDACSAMEVKEAEAGDRLGAGRVLIAPGNRHLVLHRTGNEYVAELLDAPPVCRHRPSVDVLFRSVAAAAGDAAIGVLLTGMGADGALGLLEMRQRGALTIAQDEASSVVFGMPREAILRGAADEVLSLSRIAKALSGAKRTAARERHGANGASTNGEGTR